LQHLDKKEGLPSEKQMKSLKKVGASLTQLKIDIEAKEKDIAAMKQKESDLYRKKIAEFEEELKTYQGGLKKEAYYFYKSGLELGQQRIADVSADLDRRDNEMGELQHIADNFSYPQELNNSRKLMSAMRDDVLHVKQLWDFEVKRIQETERFLVQKWGSIVAGDMEDEIKHLFKNLKEIKVDRKCDAYQGMQDVMKKWTTFCPLVGELLDKAMRPRHWTQLMALCGKNITVSPDVLLAICGIWSCTNSPIRAKTVLIRQSRSQRWKSCSQRSQRNGQKSTSNSRHIRIRMCRS